MSPLSSRPDWSRSCRSGAAGVSLLLAASLLACSDDEGPAADRLGVGGECSVDSQCEQRQLEASDEQIALLCLPFKGGYCGLRGCNSDRECPEASACVAHEDGKNYCFRVCKNKSECNANRSADLESNCSSNVDFVGGAKDFKACVPPSG